MPNATKAATISAISCSTTRERAAPKNICPACSNAFTAPKKGARANWEARASAFRLCATPLLSTTGTLRCATAKAEDWNSCSHCKESRCNKNHTARQNPAAQYLLPAKTAGKPKRVHCVLKEMPHLRQSGLGIFCLKSHFQRRKCRKYNIY